MVIVVTVRGAISDVSSEYCAISGKDCGIALNKQGISISIV